MKVVLWSAFFAFTGSHKSIHFVCLLSVGQLLQCSAIANMFLHANTNDSGVSGF